MIVVIPPLCNCLSFVFLACLLPSTLALVRPNHSNLPTNHFGPNHLCPMFGLLGFAGWLLVPLEVFGRKIVPFAFDGPNRNTLSLAAPGFQQLFAVGPDSLFRHN